MSKKRLHIDDQVLHAYLDGVLDADEARAVAEAVAADRDLAAKLGHFQRQIAGLHDLYDHILDEPVPDSMLKILDR